MSHRSLRKTPYFASVAAAAFLFTPLAQAETSPQRAPKLATQKSSLSSSAKRSAVSPQTHRTPKPYVPPASSARSMQKSPATLQSAATGDASPRGKKAEVILAIAKDQPGAANLTRAWEHLIDWQAEQAIPYLDAAAREGASKSYLLPWGYGAANIVLRKFPESEKWFERAVLLNPKSSPLLADFGFLYLSWGISVSQSDRSARGQAESARYFDAAENRLRLASQYGPQQSLPYSRLALLRFYQRRYAEAWQFVKKSRPLGGEDLDTGFLAALTSKVPEPG